MTSLAPFSLNDLEGTPRSFPSDRASLLCFIREECETCHLSMPVIEAVYRAYGDAINVWAVGQEDNQKLREQHRVTVPILDDTALKVSFDTGYKSFRRLFWPTPQAPQSPVGKPFIRATGKT